MSRLGLVGKKCGMSRIFTENGDSIPVTVIMIDNNRITQLKTVEQDGYNAVQITAGSKKATRVSKAIKGHLEKAKVDPGEKFWEFRVTEDELADFKLGESLPVTFFKEKQKVDITGVSKGKGFAGTVRRHNFHMQRATHGNSLSHRVPGSIGQNQTPGRVFKGKKMAGHMGHENVTTLNLEIVRIDEEANLLIVKGAVPGATNGRVIIKPSVKNSSSIVAA